jgi:hypothetical protein
MLVVVGGHSRNIGKTSVVAGLIRAIPEARWTAMKITQFGHGVCSTTGKPCGCCLEPEHPYAIMREPAPSHSDTGRFVAAGARDSYWVRTAAGQLHHALPAIREVLAASENLIVESNSLLQFLTPHLYLVVLDFAQKDFKVSSLRFLERADALITIERGLAEPVWSSPSDGWRHKLRFPAQPPQYVSPALSRFVGARLACSSGVAG